MPENETCHWYCNANVNTHLSIILYCWQMRRWYPIDCQWKWEMRHLWEHQSMHNTSKNVLSSYCLIGNPNAHLCLFCHITNLTSNIDIWSSFPRIFVYMTKELKNPQKCSSQHKSTSYTSWRNRSSTFVSIFSSMVV